MFQLFCIFSGNIITILSIQQELNSQNGSVRLRNLTPSASGMYMCEVTIDRTFETLFAQKTIQVTHRRRKSCESTFDCYIFMKIIYFLSYSSILYFKSTDSVVVYGYTSPPIHVLHPLMVSVPSSK